MVLQQIIDDEIAHGTAGLHSGAADMRGQHHIWHGQQTLGNMRFIGKHIQPGGPEPAIGIGTNFFAKYTF